VSWKPARARVSYQVKLMFKSRLTLPVLASQTAVTLQVPTGLQVRKVAILTIYRGRITGVTSAKLLKPVRHKRPKKPKPKR
jgi:hypothetical protein